jgi:hypothetical protein
MQNAGKYILFLGIVLTVAGLILIAGGDKFRWLGRLPGDIRIEKEHFRFYFPVTTMILVSLLLSLILHLFRKFF